MTKLEKKINGLGWCAAQCDLWAAQPHVSSHERIWLRERAELYRDEQLALLQRQLDGNMAFWAEIWEILTSPTAKDVYGCLTALFGLFLVAEMVLGMFGPH